MHQLQSSSNWKRLTRLFRYILSWISREFSDLVIDSFGSGGRRGEWNDRGRKRSLATQVSPRGLTDFHSASSFLEITGSNEWSRAFHGRIVNRGRLLSGTRRHRKKAPPSITFVYRPRGARVNHSRDETTFFLLRDNSLCREIFRDSRDESRNVQRSTKDAGNATCICEWEWVIRLSEWLMIRTYYEHLSRSW